MAAHSRPDTDPGDLGQKKNHLPKEVVSDNVVYWSCGFFFESMLSCWFSNIRVILLTE